MSWTDSTMAATVIVCLISTASNGKELGKN